MLKRFSPLTLAAAILALPVLASAATTSKKPAVEPSKGPITLEQLKSLSWRSIGPANMGGRVSQIELVPGKPASFYVATATGGLFRTSNDGTTFAPLFDSQPVVSIGSVAVAGAEAKTVWVGTGEGNGRNSSTWGDGIYKSTDGGESFVNMGLRDARDIPRLAIDPTNPDIVFAAALGHLWDANKERGLFRTADGGKSWKPALQIDENTGAIDVAIDPANPKNVFAAMYARRRQPWGFSSGGFGDKGGIYRSTDGGTTFAKLTDGLPKKTGRIGLAVWAKDPTHVWAVVEADDAGTVSIDENLSRAGGVFHSTDGGSHWTRTSRLTPRSFYFSKITVDPKDENRVYVLGYGLSISDDGGKTFRANGANIVHGDLHSLVVDPADTDRLLMGTDGGVYESRDRAATWRYIDNLAIGEFYEIGLGMDSPYTICGGLQDNGTWCGPSKGKAFFGESDDKLMNISNQDWNTVWWGDGYYAQLDPRDPNLIYAEAQEGYIARINRTSGSIRMLRPAPKEGSVGFRFNWDSPIALSKHDPDVVYLGGNHLFRMKNKGEDWEMISPDLSSREVPKILSTGSGAENHGTIVALAESPLAKGLLWAGTDDGNVWLTKDDGGSWENLTAHLSGVPKGTWVSRIEASHFDPAVALAAFDGHRTGDNRPWIFETRDSGKSWKPLASNLPDGGPVKVVREDPSNANLLFCGTEFGLFLSLDRGAHWLSMRGENFPAVMVHDLQIHPRERDLVVGTHGRSIYVIDDLTGLEQLTAETMAKGMILLTPRPATGFYLQMRGGIWGNDRFAAKNPPPGANFNFWLKDRAADGVKITVTNSAGRKVRELKGAGEPGLGRIVWDLTIDKEERIDPPEAGITGQTPFAPAGDYEVTLTVGKESSKAKLTVSYPGGVGPEILSAGMTP